MDCTFSVQPIPSDVLFDLYTKALLKEKEELQKQLKEML